jgi:hypothetical protein
MEVPGKTFQADIGAEYRANEHAMISHFPRLKSGRRRFQIVYHHPP